MPILLFNFVNYSLVLVFFFGPLPPTERKHFLCPPFFLERFVRLSSGPFVDPLQRAARKDYDLAAVVDTAGVHLSEK